MTATESLHTAARRYCIDRAKYWRAKYAEIEKRNERPATLGLLAKLGLTVQHQTREGSATFPRYKILDAILIEVERRIGEEFPSLPDMKLWLIAAAQSAYEEEARPPDLVMSSMKEAFSPDVRERLQALGRKAKIVLGHESEIDRTLQNGAMKDECDSFAAYLNGLSSDGLANIEGLAYRRTLRDNESDRLWSLLGSRWGVDGQWYPTDRGGEDAPPEDTVAFQAAPFFDNRLVEAIQGVLRREGVTRVYELREFASSANYELDIELLRPWYTLDEGYWLDDSADWILYASHEGSVTVGGARLLPALKEVWSNWYEYVYAARALGVEREVGPGVMSTSVHVAPPPGDDSASTSD